jgi:hypothetical protein
MVLAHPEIRFQRERDGAARDLQDSIFDLRHEITGRAVRIIRGRRVLAVVFVCCRNPLPEQRQCERVATARRHGSEGGCRN